MRVLHPILVDLCEFVVLDPFLVCDLEKLVEREKQCKNRHDEHDHLGPIDHVQIGTLREYSERIFFYYSYLIVSVPNIKYREPLSLFETVL